MHIKVVHILKTHNCAYFKVHICGNFVHVQFCILLHVIAYYGVWMFAYIWCIFLFCFFWNILLG